MSHVIPSTLNHSAVWFELGNMLQQRLQYREAVECYRKALHAHSEDAGAHNNLGVALMALHDYEGAVAAFAQAIRIRPEYADAHNNMGVASKNMGREEDALRCYMKALEYRPDYAQALFNIGTLHYNRKRFDEALSWYRASLAINPDQVEANQNVAIMLLEAGYVNQAKVYRDRAYRSQSVFVDVAPAPVRSILVLWSSARGNIPIEYLLPRHTNTRIVWMIEYADLSKPADLPPYALVLNAIGDPDAMEPVALSMRTFLESCRLPVLNLPACVMRTARERLPQTLSDIEGVVVPMTLKLVPSDVVNILRALPPERFPVLLRPSGSHGGAHLIKVDTVDAVAALELWPADAYYLTDYCDFRSADGCYRKYRVIYVDRRPYAYHLAVGDDWMVHYETAGMLESEAKRLEEQAFLREPVAVLGETAMAAIEAIGRSLDLDYAGVDFSLLDDGRVLIFEANATMLVHPETEHPMLTYKNSHVQKILDAFDAHLTRCTANGSLA